MSHEIVNTHGVTIALEVFYGIYYWRRSPPLRPLLHLHLRLRCYLDRLWLGRRRIKITLITIAFTILPQMFRLILSLGQRRTRINIEAISGKHELFFEVDQSISLHRRLLGLLKLLHPISILQGVESILRAGAIGSDIPNHDSSAIPSKGVLEDHR